MPFSTFCHCKNPIPDCSIYSAVPVPGPAQPPLCLLTGHLELQNLVNHAPSLWEPLEGGGGQCVGKPGRKCAAVGLVYSCYRQTCCVSGPAWGAEINTTLFLSCLRCYVCIQAIEHQNLFSCGWKYFSNLLLLISAMLSFLFSVGKDFLMFHRVFIFVLLPYLRLLFADSVFSTTCV